MSDDASPAMLTMLLTVLAGSLIFTFGSLHAKMGRANKDYKTTKAAVPALRKTFRELLWRAIKVGFWVVLGGLILVAWAIHDVTKAAP